MKEQVDFYVHAYIKLKNKKNFDNLIKQLELLGYNVDIVTYTARHYEALAFGPSLLQEQLRDLIDLGLVPKCLEE